ncbi:hypothetical protein JXB31_04645 [Candidatus Woesearchaeota archaeon]|nr:hypothetical protein [Candidatus Woesearchaeota archaeon]
MAKYKKNVEQRQYSAEYLRFDEDETKLLAVSDWTYPKDSNYLFRCYVIRENGKPVDKIWTIWDYDSMQNIKKALGTKYISPKEIKVRMYKNPDEDVCFEIVS